MSAVVSPFGTATDHGDVGTLRFLASYTYWSIAQWDNDCFPTSTWWTRPSAPWRAQQRSAGRPALAEVSDVGRFATIPASCSPAAPCTSSDCGSAGCCGPPVGPGKRNPT